MKIPSCSSWVQSGSLGNLFQLLKHAFMTAARHHADLILCRKQPGIAVGRLCEKCDGKCPVCDSNCVTTLVHICDECNYGSNRPSAASSTANTNTMLSSVPPSNKAANVSFVTDPGVSDAYYCKQCTLLEKDRDGVSEDCELEWCPFGHDLWTEKVFISSHQYYKGIKMNMICIRSTRIDVLVDNQCSIGRRGNGGGGGVQFKSQVSFNSSNDEINCHSQFEVELRNNCPMNMRFVLVDCWFWVLPDVL